MRERLACKPVRYAMLALGVVCTAVGIAGVVLPGLPGTIFLLVAVWAFSRSSERFHRWLYDHPRFGKPIRDWHEYRVIPTRAKLLAVTMMAISFVAMVLMEPMSPTLLVVIGLVMAGVAIWIATRAAVAPR